MEDKNGQMAPDTKETGKMTKLMVSEDYITLMAIYMKVNGWMTKHMDMVFTLMPMVPNIRDNGKKINSMVRG